MQVLYARSCGLAGPEQTVGAGVRLAPADGTVRRQTRTFGTLTADRRALSDRLAQQGVTHVALASPGVSGQPVYNLLEAEARTLVLVNAPHLPAVPGRQTGIQDSAWLADRLRPGLLRARCGPPAPIRALRELTRYRQTLVREVMTLSGPRSRAQLWRAIRGSSRSCGAPAL